MRRLAPLALALLAAPALASPAALAAQNLVQNGGFETAIYTSAPPWSGTGEYHEVTTDLAHTGTHSYRVLSVPQMNGFGGSFSGVRQTLATTPGATYALEFWTAHRGLYFGSGAVNVYWGDALVGSYAYDQPGATGDGSGFTEIALAVTAASSSTTLEFVNAMFPCTGNTCDDAGAWVYLDNVSVTAAPEPATLALTLGGLAVLGAVVRRRRV